MENLNTLFQITCLLGLIFIIAGLLLYKFPPKKINPLFGYRTRQSMGSIEKWNFAQFYSSILMMKSGLFLIGIAFLSLCITISETISVIIGIVCLLAITIYLFVKTEKKLKQKFNNDNKNL